MRYETDSMAELRELLKTTGTFDDKDVDTFKMCLIFLERRGFTLTKQVEVRVND
jgi:hypothetical protein